MLWYKQISCDSLYIRLHAVVGEGARANEIQKHNFVFVKKNPFQNVKSNKIKAWTK